MAETRFFKGTLGPKVVFVGAQLDLLQPKGEESILQHCLDRIGAIALAPAVLAPIRMPSVASLWFIS